MPVVVVPPGVRTRFHVPVAGNPLNATLPVDNAQVGCVIVPTRGADGVTGCALITISADDAEMHPAALVTVKVYVVAAERPLTEVDVPVPVEVVPPGLRVSVHVPVDGNPFRITLAVEAEHVGWMIVPTSGAEGTVFTVKV